MSGYKKDYSMADDRIYSKYGKIVQMMDDLQTSGCFDSTYSQPVFRLVVTGPNGAGKDSFINAILGYPFLPPNCKSKRQMEIRILHSVEDVSPMVQIEELKKSFTNHMDCSRNLADLQKATNDSNQNTSIRMNFTTNTSADLYIISTCEQDPSNPYAQSLLKEALSPSSNFIILVMEAMHLNDNFTHLRDEWFNLIKHYDPNLARTMVILTKCDILPNNFNYNKIKQYLRDSNEIFSPKYGFVCVKTNAQSHLEPADQFRLEREYFCNHKVFQFLSINDYFTLDVAGEKITRWIWQTNEFKKNLVFAYSRLKERMKFVDEELQKFGNEFIDFSTQSKDLYLQSMMHILSDTVVKIFSGKCEIEEYNLSNINLNKLYVDFLGHYIDYQPSLTFKNKDIIEEIQKTEESGLAGFPSGDVIYSLLEKKVEDLRNELADYLDKVYTIVHQLFKSLVNRYFSRFPKALNSIEELILSFFEQEFAKIKDLQTDLSEMNFTYLYVDELNEKYKSLIQNNLLKRSHTTDNGPLTNTNQNNNNFPFKENKDISFFKAAKDKDSYYQGLADYVKALVDYIYAEIIRNLREYIPKSTANFFIKSLKTNMKFYLLQYLSKNPEFCQELEEDPEIAQKRVYYVEANKKLKKINKMCDVDEQIKKIVNVDNIKSIDTILQSQDINPQNSSEIDKEVGNSSAKNLSLKGQSMSNPLITKKDNKASNVNTNLFGVPPKKDSSPALGTYGNTNTTTTTAASNNKTKISSSTKANLFGPSTATNKNTNAKANNLFGTNTNTNKNASAANNLFGNTNTMTNTKKTQAKNNLFGTPQQQQNRATNLFGNPKNDQKKDLNVSLKMDPKQGKVTGVNVQGDIDPEDAYKFYQNNKQYIPSGKQMLAGAQAANKFYQETNNNNTNTKKSGLANLFGTGKK
jgi:hypothetical protein